MTYYLKATEHYAILLTKAHKYTKKYSAVRFKIDTVIKTHRKNGFVAGWYIWDHQKNLISFKTRDEAIGYVALGEL